MPVAFWQDYEFDVPDGVYYPAEDTYLLLDYLAEIIVEAQPRDLCEIGCGSGIVGISLALLCPEMRATLTDIDPFALQAARSNAMALKVTDRVGIHVSNLFWNVPKGMTFDWVVFNPPYLPATGEVEDSAIVRQTEGGPSGLRVIRHFLGEVTEFLKPNSRVFFIASSLSPLKVLERVCARKQVQLWRRRVDHVFFEDVILFECQFP